MIGRYLAGYYAEHYYEVVTGWWWVIVAVLVALAVGVGFLLGRRARMRIAVAPTGALAGSSDASPLSEAEVLRRDFVANVSHELKSPVTTLGLLAEAVLAAADTPETVTGFAQQMQREATRLGTLISEIIALTAIQGGTLHEVDLVPVDTAIADAIDRITVGANAAGIDLATDAPSGAEVLGDRGLITTAVGNLIDNAINYSEPGATVHITRIVRDGCVEIAVTDTGIGISPSDQQRVFERFFRADPARSRATGGTGLGLAIVKHVAANHRGSVRLVSKVGEGSTFTLLLPLAGSVEPPRHTGSDVGVPHTIIPRTETL